MSATCTFCGGNLAPGVLHDPKQCAPERGLDFEKARDDVRERHHKRLVEMPNPDALVFFESEVRAALNAQVAEIVRAERAQSEALRALHREWVEARKAVDKFLQIPAILAQDTRFILWRNAEAALAKWEDK